MKKNFITTNILLLLLGAGIASYGKAVSENTAKTIGSNFLISNNIPGVSSSNELATSYVATAQINGANVVDYYVFNFTSGPGFIMVSGDDNIIPVLAYSFESFFDRQKMSPSAKDWTEGYQNQITAALEHNLPAREGTAEQWANLMVARNSPAARTTAVFPSSTYFLCNTTWDQLPVYNNLCPGSSPTGCVATAMAQVMKYWNWPSVGCASHTYTPPGGMYGGQTADFGSTGYDWTSMNTSLTAANAAIETLMYHVGVSLDMQYTPSESGTYVTKSETSPPYTNNAEYAFPTYFRYKRSLKGYLRSGTVITTSPSVVLGDIYNAFHTPTQAAYSTSGWISLIQAELNAKRPLLYKGVGSAGGHCWVCDGYDATNKMHFNWGWGGMGPNGYYTVDAIAPPSLGTGGGGGNFNTDQAVLMGIMPDSALSSTGKIKMASFLDVPNNDPYVYNAPISAIATVTNTNTTAFSGSIAAQVFDTLNHYVATIQTLTSQTIAAGSTSSALIFSNPSGLMAMIPGRYIVRIMYQATGTTTWTAAANSGIFYNDNRVDVRITGFTSDLLEVYAPVAVTTGTNMIINGPINVTTKIMNNMFSPSSMTGHPDYSGAIQGTLINTTTGATFVVQNFPSETIANQNFNSYTFNNAHVTAASGQYVFAVQYEPSGSSSFLYAGSDFYVNPVIVQIHTNVGVNTVTLADNIAVFPNPARDVVNIIAQDVTIDHITVTDMQGREILAMNVDSNQHTINIRVSSFAPGIYLAQIHTPEGMVTKKIVIAK